MLPFPIAFLSLAAALDVFFINNTPRVRGGESGSVYAELATTSPNSELLCRLKRFENDDKDCKYFLIFVFNTCKY